MKTTRLLPATPPTDAHIGYVPISYLRAVLYLLAGVVLTVVTFRTNPGALGWIGGVVALGLLVWVAHRHDDAAVASIEAPPTEDGLLQWARTGAATVVWATLILLAGMAAEHAVRTLLNGAYPLPDTGPTVLLPGLASTITLLTATLLGWAGVRAAELYTMVASIAVLSALAAQGWEATPGALPLAAATVGLTWLYRRTRRGGAVYVAELVAVIVAWVVVRQIPVVGL